MAEPMNLYKHPNGKFYVRFSRSERPPRGQLVSLKTVIGKNITDEKTAKRILRILKKELFKRKIIELESGKKINISNLADIFISDPDRLNLSPDTHRMDRLALKNLAAIIGNKSVCSITRNDFKKFKDVLFARGLSPYSINSYRRHILAALNWAKDEGYIRRIPKFKTAKTGKRLPRSLSAKNIDRILEYSEKNDYEMFRIIKFTLWTGCRRGDVGRIDWRNVQGRTCKVIGKGDKERTLYLLDPALEVMEELKNLGIVFKKFHKDTISHRFKKIVDALGIEARFHDLRHTTATYLLKSKVPLEYIQKVLGHADIRTTQIYTEVFDEMVFDEMEKLKF